MELVRELSLSFADDGKRVKVIIATNTYIFFFCFLEYRGEQMHILLFVIPFPSPQ
jgi:hypothetical protein